MPDEIDRSQEHQEAILAASIENARQVQSTMRPKGRCYFCDENLTGDQLFCDPDCTADHERLTKQRRQRI